MYYINVYTRRKFIHIIIVFYNLKKMNNIYLYRTINVELHNMRVG